MLPFPGFSEATEDERISIHLIVVVQNHQYA